MGFSPGYDHGNVHKVISTLGLDVPYVITPDQSGYTFLSQHPLTAEFVLPADTTEIGFHCTIINVPNVSTGVSGRHFKISTAGDGQLMLGAIASVGGAAKQDVFIANGSSHDNIIMDAAAEGGGIGQWFECTLVGVDKWLIHGHGNIAGTAAPVDPWSNG